MLARASSPRWSDSDCLHREAAFAEGICSAVNWEAGNLAPARERDSPYTAHRIALLWRTGHFEPRALRACPFLPQDILIG
jgi:hypothetical protein